MAYLNFILLKVNGVDVSNCSQEEAVQVFLSAEEPITVEVKRRSSSCTSTSSTSSSSNNSNELSDGGSPKRTPVVVGKQTASVAVQTDDLDLLAEEDPVFDESPVSDQIVNIFDECLVPDVDFEEITLKKTNSQEQLGLTVSYIHCATGSAGGGVGGGSGSVGGGNNSGGNSSVKSINEVDSETSTEVYISNILPDSIAARDGRLRQGDQILQVNGRDVSDKEETESLFAENKKAVTLLVSRYLSIDDYFENSDEMYSDNELWNEDSDEKRLLMESMKSPSVTTPPSAVQTKETVSPKRQQSFAREKAPTPNNNNNSTTAATTTPTEQLSKLLYHNDPLHHTKVKAHLESVNNEIQMLDQRMEQLMMNNNNNNKSNGGPKGKAAEEEDEVSATSQEVYQDPVDSRPSIPRSNSMVERFSSSRIHQIVDSETEHIYETIPEYSETEPIYCSPHDSHVDLMHNHQQQHPHQHQHHQQHRHGQSMTKTGVPLMRWSKSFSAKDKGTRQQQQQQHPIMSHHQRLSSGDDNCDNTNQCSSSPFNTTDSGNSNKFLTLEFCANERAQCQGSTLVLCAPAAQARRDKRNSSGGVEVLDRNGRRSGDKAATNVKVAKQKVKLPGNSRMPNSLSNGHFGADEKMSKSFSASSTLPASDTMYTNAANLEQTITLQQEMFRQAMLKQKMLQHQQFLQSQKAAAAAAAAMQHTGGGGGAKDQQSGRRMNGQQDNNNKEKLDGDGEEQRMEWKVKRRPDGSRYIVRRPVQSRALRNREMKINAERSQNCCGNEVTTEDDTMSEIKLGRYWNKDERKKHMEKAKDRRHRQEQVLENVKLLQRKNQLNTIQGSSEESAGTKGTTAMIVGNGGGGGGSGLKGLEGRKVVIVDQQQQQQMGLMQQQPGQPAATATLPVECKDNKIMGLLSVTTV